MHLFSGIPGKPSRWSPRSIAVKRTRTRKPAVPARPSQPPGSTARRRREIRAFPALAVLGEDSPAATLFASAPDTPGSTERPNFDPELFRLPPGSIFAASPGEYYWNIGCNFFSSDLLCVWRLPSFFAPSLRYHMKGKKSIIQSGLKGRTMTNLWKKVPFPFFRSSKL